MLEKAQKIKEEYEQLNVDISKPDIMSNNKLYQEKTKKHSELSPIVEKYNEYLEQKMIAKDSQEMIDANEDHELVEMAKADLESANDKIKRLTEELELMLTPKDPNDAKNAIMEIRAGTGGDEAGLFAADLFKMYSKYAEFNNYKIDVVSSSPTNLGGFKEIIFSFEGPDAYSKMKFESGVHRVQRVPDTETSGRIHTSAVSVAVLPEQEEVDFEIKPEDLKIEVCRASGAGGQHVNTTESAVRIVHLPTMLEVQCQDERSQLKNRAKAMKVLRARVKNKIESEEKSKIDQDRKSQVGSGDRSEKIRTYNFPQNRVTDHRISYTSYSLERVMEGEIEDFIEKLTIDANKKLLESQN